MRAERTRVHAHEKKVCLGGGWKYKDCGCKNKWII